MRKILAVAVAFVVMCVPVCEAATRFVTFPTVGVCTGSSVRYRARPDTKSDIWGRLNVGEKVIVDGKTSVNGETWYKILPKDMQDSAFVFGKYLVPYYDEEIQQSPIGKMIIEILLTYAPYLENDYYDEDNSPEVKRFYGDDHWLHKVEAWNPGSNFGEIEIGDNIDKLTEILGEPDSESNSELRYIAGEFGAITFKVKNGKITRMIFDE